MFELPFLPEKNISNNKAFKERKKEKKNSSKSVWFLQICYPWVDKPWKKWKKIVSKYCRNLLSFWKRGWCYRRRKWIRRAEFEFLLDSVSFTSLVKGMSLSSFSYRLNSREYWTLGVATSLEVNLCITN